MNQYSFKIRKVCDKGKVFWDYGDDGLDHGQALCGHTYGDIFANVISYYWHDHHLTVDVKKGLATAKTTGVIYSFPIFDDADTCEIRAKKIQGRIASMIRFVKDSLANDASVSGEATITLSEEDTSAYVQRKAAETMKKDSNDPPIPF